MALEKTTYVVAVCDSCGPDWWDDGETDYAPLFITAQAARQNLAANYEWRITRQIDGRLRMICSACANAEDCDRYGHDWGANTARSTVCRRCSYFPHADNPPAGHPESMTAELPADQEEALAALDAELFPEELS